MHLLELRIISYPCDPIVASAEIPAQGMQGMAYLPHGFASNLIEELYELEILSSSCRADVRVIIEYTAVAQEFHSRASFRSYFLGFFAQLLGWLSRLFQNKSS